MKLSFKDRMQDLADRLPGGTIVKVVAGGIAGYLVIALVLGIIWSASPEVFNVQNNAVEYSESRSQDRVVGYTAVATLHRVASTLLEKPGGYLTNDVTFPGLWLDNMPSWEFGVLVQSRDLFRAMRKDMARSQSQSTEDPDLAEAEPKMNFDNDSWMFPASEGEYRDALTYLERYMVRLADPNNPRAQFYARADNLATWLKDVETRLGSLSQRLSASVGQVRLNTDLANDAAATQATKAAAQELVKTSWLEIDDVFYETRGTAWALIHILKAVEVDFEQVLVKKNAQVSLRQIIRELEATQETVWSPIILNGSGFGMLANHSLVMANYISRANASIIELRELLERG